MDIIPGGNKTEVGTCIGDEKPSLVRVACALRRMLDDVIQGVGISPGIRNLLESAAQNIFIEASVSPQLQEPGIERKVVKAAESIVPTCTHSCAHHAKLMDNALPRALPEELQDLVFAHLPWPQIYQVRTLSKGWNQKLMSGADNSQWKRACAIAQPKLFALLASGSGADLRSVTVNMFDTASNRWRAYETSPGNDIKCGEIQGVSASDGGLVCFLSKETPKSRETPCLVFVCNPLTQLWNWLPPLDDILQRRSWCN